MDGGSSLLSFLMTIQTYFIDTMQVALLILGSLSTVKVRVKHILPQVHVFTSSYKTTFFLVLKDC